MLGEMTPNSAIPAAGFFASPTVASGETAAAMPITGTTAAELTLPVAAVPSAPPLPDSGKILPPRLPVAEMETPHPEEAAKSQSSRPRKDRTNPKVEDHEASPQAVLPEAALTHAAPTAQQQSSAFLAAREAAPATQPTEMVVPAVAAPVALPGVTAAAAVVETQTQPVGKELTPDVTRPALAPRGPVALPVAAKPQADQPGEGKARPAALPVIAPVAAPAASAAAPAVQPLVQAPQQDPIAPAIAAPVRQILAAGRREEEARPRSTAMAEAPSLPFSAEPTPTSHLAPRLQIEAPATRPLDFAALVDRLAAAREAAQPQTVSIALPHAEFGRIALRFHHDDSGLAVSMASPDPEFARAAAQALPPVSQTSASESFTASSQQQSGTSAERGASSGDQSALTRQHGREQREERDAGRDAGRPSNQSNARDGRPERPRRQGIFA